MRGVRGGPGAVEQQSPSPDIPGEYKTIDQLWAGIDPAAHPLDVQAIEQWSADGIDYRRLYFTGEIWEGEPTRIYAIEGVPNGCEEPAGNTAHSRWRANRECGLGHVLGTTRIRRRHV